MNGQIITIVSRLIQAFGAYMVIVGAIEFFKGQGDQNPELKSKGQKEFIAGVLIALVVPPIVEQIIKAIA